MSSCGSTDTSSPPAVPVHPAKTKTSEKRKREQDFEHIIDEVEAIKDGERLSPETMAIAERIVTRAKSSTGDPELVELSFGMFRKIVKAGKAARKDREDMSQRFLMDIGDCVAAIIYAVSNYEPKVVEVYKHELIEEVLQSDPELK